MVVRFLTICCDEEELEIETAERKNKCPSSDVHLP